MAKKEIEHGLGALPPKVDIRDYKFAKAKCMSVDYPDVYECPIKTAIKDQGSVGSCVAHSGAEILEYHYPGTKMSTNFLYGIHKKLYNSDGPGMYTRECAKIMKDYGDPLYEHCPGNTEITRVYKIAEEAFANTEVMANSKKHRISSFARVSSVNDIKYALVTYGPVLGSIVWYNDNKVDRATGLLTQGTKFGGGHAIVVRGWNDQGWICQNSWGSYWGNKGYFILPYTYKLVEAYSIIPGEPGDDIVKPNLWSWVYKLINAILNIFKKGY